MVISLINFIGLLCINDEKFNCKYNAPKEGAVSTMPNKGVNAVAINMTEPIGSNSSTSSDEIVKLYELKEKGIIAQ